MKIGDWEQETENYSWLIVGYLSSGYKSNSVYLVNLNIKYKINIL